VQAVDYQGREVATGQHGELVARGANVMRGHLKGTNAVFRDGMFRSGDIGCQDADGYIHILPGQRNRVCRTGRSTRQGLPFYELLMTCLPTFYVEEANV
jgi:non-ribosomal peptide synthetase component E (peptide arylation enzyme)